MKKKHRASRNPCLNRTQNRVSRHKSSSMASRTTASRNLSLFFHSSKVAARELLGHKCPSKTLAQHYIHSALYNPIHSYFYKSSSSSGFNHLEGIRFPLGVQQTRECTVRLCFPYELTKNYGTERTFACFTRSFASTSATEPPRQKSQTRKEVSTVEDPFDAPTYNIPEKPVTFTEGASYSVVILLGLGVAAAAAYGVFKELIFEPKEYKIFGKALERVQNDSQVRVRIGSPMTGYGQETRNRAARQRISHRVWTDEDGVEHVEVNFYIRGPHGAGTVHAEMFKDKVDKQWKYTYLIVQINSPSRAQLMLESYVPA